MFTHVSKYKLALLMLFITLPLLADDTEILNRSTPPPPPKIMFLMDNSASMDDPVPGDASSRNRMQVLQDTFSNVADAMDQSISVGMTTYGGGTWRERGVSFPISTLSDNATTILTRNLLQNDTSISPAIPANSTNHVGMYDLTTDNLSDPSSSSVTVKDYLKELVSSWSSYGNTPIPGSIYEVTRYFKGESPRYGHTQPTASHAAHPSTYTGSVYQTKGSNQSTDNCATQALCTLRDTSDPSACELKSSVGIFSTTHVAPCIADGTCTAYCSFVPAAAAAPVAPFTSTKVDCISNTNPTCGINCGANKGTPSEPLYTCDSTAPPPPSAPAATYSCSQYYQCKRPVADSWATTWNATYTSPITDECDSSFLVLLSDGQPFDDLYYTQSRQTDIKSYLSLASCTAIPGEDDSLNTLSYGRCAPELVHHLANTDLNSTLDGDQYVKTYTIGFGVGDPSPAKDYLRLLASKGGGRYFSADSSARLTQVFQDLLTNIAQQSALSLTSSGFSVNTGTQISHNNDVFIPVMKKIDGQPEWAGNIKKFTLSNGRIVDPSDNRAIRADGAIRRNAVDLWTTGSVADPVLSGGAASLLDPVNRKLYTNISGTNNTSGNKGTWGAPLNELKTSNNDITLAMLSVPTTAYRNEVLDYVRGYTIPPSGSKECTDPAQANVTDTGNCGTRLHMGDILHSSPVVVSFDDNDTSKRFVFFGTNEGYLHAISADDGQEKFAFMPQSLLDNIDVLYRNSSSDPHPYGVDGAIRVWKHDENHDGVIDASDGDHVYLYFGLRRGGSAYYALNVTDPATPKLLWKIDNQTTNFSELAQTWSKPLLAKIRYKQGSSTIETQAMVVGAGYDPVVDLEDRDGRTAPSGNLTETHTMGRGVYIINANTGAKIAAIFGGSNTGAVSGMDYSVPGDIRVLDMDKNGFMDRFYFADLGGNIWRTDLFTDSTDPLKLATSTYKFASLGEDTLLGSLELRKFFNEPEVSLFNYRGVPTLAVTTGSGYHSRPLNTTTTDRFYVLMDKDVFAPPETTPTPILYTDLVDQRRLTTSISTNTNGKLGWFYDLPNSGEKVLASPSVFLNKVLFTTFKPGSGGLSGGVCTTSNSHETRLYAFDLLTGAAAIDFDSDGTKEISKLLPESHILGKPHLFFNTPSCADKDNCSQVVEIKTSIGAPVLTTSTHPGVATRETATGSIDLGSFLPKVYWLNKHQ